jgi:hypothetical protein
MHPWMFRFGFPGFAETEWILPAGVERDDPRYEALPPVMACQDLLDWSLDEGLADRLRDLHASGSDNRWRTRSASLSIR